MYPTNKKVVNVPAIVLGGLAAILAAVALFLALSNTNKAAGVDKAAETPAPVVESVEPSAEPSVEPSETPVSTNPPKATSVTSKDSTLKAIYSEEARIDVAEVVDVTADTTVDELTQATVETMEPVEVLEVLENIPETPIDFETVVAIEAPVVEQAIEEKQTARVEKAEAKANTFVSTPDVGVKTHIAADVTSTAPVVEKYETSTSDIYVREDKTVAIVEDKPETTKTSVQVVDTETTAVKVEAEVEEEGQVAGEEDDTVIITETTTTGTEYHGFVVEEPVETPAPVVIDDVVDGEFTLDFGF